MKDFAVTFVVSSDESEKLDHAKRLATSKVHPDSVFVETLRAKDRALVQRHRIGDFFSSVQVVDSGPASFRLVFVPQCDADRYWKDMVVGILASIRDAGVSIRGYRP